jgi:superfamily I DNA/RNA helicase
LRAAVAEGPDDIFISEDSHQRIYGHRITLSQFGIRIVGRSRKLRLNYRTTAENLRWAMSVLDGGAFSDLDGESEDHGYRSARKGPVPHLIPCDSLGEELDAVAATLKEWMGDEPVAAETLAVLVRDRAQQERVVNGLAERGVGVRSVDNEAIRPGQPVVMTMHRSKGTEFAKVVLFGVREGSIPAALRDQNYDESAKADALLRERSLLYVAATRARDVLAVTWSGSPSPLIQA